MKIFWMLTEESQANLMRFQYEKYGIHLNIPRRPEGKIGVDMDGIEMDEVGMAKFMQQRPHSPRKVK